MAERKPAMSAVEVLREALLFAECSADELARLATLVGDRELADGELVFNQGDQARELMLVAAGEIHLEMPVAILGQSRSVRLDTKKRGEIVGWSALVPPYRYTLSARAGGAATLATLPASDLAVLFDAEPLLGFRIMRRLAALVAQRLELTRSLWVREIQRNLEERYR